MSDNRRHSDDAFVALVEWGMAVERDTEFAEPYYLSLVMWYGSMANAYANGLDVHPFYKGG